MRPARSAWLRYLLLGIGCISVALGVIGIFLPVMPTTPFLLLAAACFARSSPRFHAWLLGHPQLGPLLKAYLGGEGIPRKAKVLAIGSTWVSIAMSCWLVPWPWLRGLLVGIALAVTVYIARLKTSAVKGQRQLGNDVDERSTLDKT